MSLCGMSAETIPAAERELPKNLCPLIKSSYGSYITDKCPYTYFADIIVGETTCDGKKKMYELMGRGKEVFVLHLPQGVELPYAKEMWRQELRRFADYLQERFGVSITEDALRSAAEKRNLLRRRWTELLELLTAIEGFRFSELRFSEKSAADRRSAQQICAKRKTACSASRLPFDLY